MPLDSRGRPDVRRMKAQARGGDRAAVDRAVDELFRRRAADYARRQRRWAEQQAAAGAAAASPSRSAQAEAEAFVRSFAPAGWTLKQAFRRAAKQLHPDAGGSRADWDRLDQAARLLGLL